MALAVHILRLIFECMRQKKIKKNGTVSGVVPPWTPWTFRFCVLCFLQKDTDHAVVVAVAARAVFEAGAEDGDDSYRVGVALTLLQVKLVFFPCL